MSEFRLDRDKDRRLLNELAAEAGVAPETMILTIAAHWLHLYREARAALPERAIPTVIAEARRSRAS